MCLFVSCCCIFLFKQCSESNRWRTMKSLTSCSYVLKKKAWMWQYDETWTENGWKISWTSCSMFAYCSEPRQSSTVRCSRIIYEYKGFWCCLQNYALFWSFPWSQKGSEEGLISFSKFEMIQEVFPTWVSVFLISWNNRVKLRLVATCIWDKNFQSQVHHI